MKHVDTINIYNRPGIALRRQGKWKEAIRECEIALTVDPRDGGLYFNTAKSYLEGGTKGRPKNISKRPLICPPT